MSPKRKKEILEEELFRSEVQKEIQSKRMGSTAKERIWKILNSSFALWFLSSVILGVITFAYSRMQSRAELEGRNVAQRKEIKLEISNRINNAKRVLADYEHRQGVIPINESRLLMLSIVLNSLNKPLDDYVFEKFQKRNYRSLLTELEALVDESERARIQENMASFNRLNLEVTESALDTAYSFTEAHTRAKTYLESTRVD